MLRLMRAAVRELATEELDLAKRSAVSGKWTGTRHVPCLGYPAYETTLGYIIWKAWLPYEIVVWDGVPRNKAKPKTKVDLAVFDEQLEVTDSISAEDAAFVFELKWVNNEDGTKGAVKDIEKLASVLAPNDSSQTTRVGSLPRCFVLLTWWERGDVWNGTESVEKSVSLKQAATWLNELPSSTGTASVEACYLGWFPCSAPKEERATVFVVALAEVLQTQAK